MHAVSLLRLIYPTTHENLPTARTIRDDGTVRSYMREVIRGDRRSGTLRNRDGSSKLGDTGSLGTFFPFFRTKQYDDFTQIIMLLTVFCLMSKPGREATLQNVPATTAHSLLSGFVRHLEAWAQSCGCMYPIAGHRYSSSDSPSRGNIIVIPELFLVEGSTYCMIAPAIIYNC